MDKADYEKYGQSEHWQNFRKKTLGDRPYCEKCGILRWLAEAVYSQDLHVHHLHYGSLGCEIPPNVTVVCRRCHQLEKFPFSQLLKLKVRVCSLFGSRYFNPYNEVCDTCDTIFNTGYLKRPSNGEHVIWKIALTQLANAAMHDGSDRDDFARWARELYEDVRSGEVQSQMLLVFDDEMV